jgi:DNA-directed RNA polymerase subunit M/transcription elongation factor TFIIS
MGAVVPMTEKVTIIPDGLVVPNNPGFCPQCGRVLQFREYVIGGRKMRCNPCGAFIVEFDNFDNTLKDLKNETSKPDKNKLRAKLHEKSEVVEKVKE